MNTPEIKLFTSPILSLDQRSDIIEIFLNGYQKVKLPKSYAGGKDFSLTGKETVTVGRDKANGDLAVSLAIDGKTYYDFAPEDYEEARRIEQSQGIVAAVVEKRNGGCYIEASRVGYGTYKTLFLEKAMLDGLEISRGDSIVYRRDKDGHTTEVSVNGELRYKRD